MAHVLDVIAAPDAHERRIHDDAVVRLGFVEVQEIVVLDDFIAIALDLFELRAPRWIALDEAHERRACLDDGNVEMPFARAWFEHAVRLTDLSHRDKLARER